MPHHPTSAPHGCYVNQCRRPEASDLPACPGCSEVHEINNTCATCKMGICEDCNTCSNECHREYALVWTVKGVLLWNNVIRHVARQMRWVERVEAVNA